MTNPFEGTSRLKKCVAAAAFNFQMKRFSMLNFYGQKLLLWCLSSVCEDICGVVCYACKAVFKKGPKQKD